MFTATQNKSNLYWLIDLRAILQTSPLHPRHGSAAKGHGWGGIRSSIDCSSSCRRAGPKEEAPKGLDNDNRDQQGTQQYQQQDTLSSSRPPLRLAGRIQLLNGDLHVLTHRLDVVVDAVDQRPLSDDETLQVLEQCRQLDDRLGNVTDLVGPSGNLGVLVCRRGILLRFQE